MHVFVISDKTQFNKNNKNKNIKFDSEFTYLDFYAKFDIIY